MCAHVWRDHVVSRHLLTFLSAADVGRLARVDRQSRRAVTRALRDFRQRSARLSLSLWTAASRLSADGVLRIYRHFGVTLATDTVDLSRTIEIKLWIAMEHMTRLYLLQSERPAATKLWLKKLQAAVRFGGGGANNHDDSSGAEKSSS
ncbi:hypothetical protein ATCC90586_006112 [Pythium insidiosum]|nr:hypothetical protein ATCC90586_006112 [Pythium insidiosum]